MTDRRYDHQRGAVLGMAIGDALGAGVELKPPGTLEPVTDYRAGGPHGLAPGEWTDETSMALAMADSMTRAGWDLSDQARQCVAWWQEGEYSVNGRCLDRNPRPRKWAPSLTGNMPAMPQIPQETNGKGISVA